MTIALPKKKARNLKVSLAYRLKKLFFFLSKEQQLKLYLDLSWIFSRLAHEQIYKASLEDIIIGKNDFLFNHIKEGDKVLDLGCGAGHVIKQIIMKTNNITAIDYNKHSLMVAKEIIKDKNIEFILDDILTVPLLYG